MLIYISSNQYKLVIKNEQPLICEQNKPNIGVQQSNNNNMDNQKVSRVYCKNCNNLITNRGFLTHLIVDHSAICYSSDYSTKQMINISQAHPFQKCKCLIIDTGCAKCSQYLGYHVIKPCVQCSISNNGHYYIFHNVRGQQTDKSWRQIPPIFKQQQDAKIQNDDLICPICFQILSEPTIITCGHTFCRRCIQRHVDLRTNCPIDKRQMKRQGPFIPNRLVESILIQEKQKINKQQIFYEFIDHQKEKPLKNQ